VIAEIAALFSGLRLARADCFRRGLERHASNCADNNRRRHRASVRACLERTIRHRHPGLCDRLNIAAFSLGPEAEAAFAAEAARMDRLCQHHEYECLTRNIQHTSVTLATVHEAPSADSRVVGHILAVVIVSADRFENFGSLTIELDFGPSGSNERLVWIATVGDWGYGILVHGVRTRRDWIQLSGRLFPKNAWVWRNSPGFSATVDALDGAILALDPLEASEQTAEDSSWRRAVTRSCE
jgi:hypothetical protein